MNFELPWKRKTLSEIWTWPQISCFNFFGFFWTDDASIPKSKKRFLNFYRFYNIVSCIFMFFSVVIVIVLKFVTGEIFEGLFVIFTIAPIVLGLIKMIQADRHMRTFEVVIKAINELNINTTDQYGVFTVTRTMRTTWIIFIVSIFITGFGALHWLIRPIFYMILYNKKTMVVDSWPNFTHSWIIFIPAYIYQFSLICCMANFYIVFDALFFSLSEFIMCHFDILKFKLRNLVMKKAPIDNLELRGIVEVHIQLLEICKNLKDATEGVFVPETLIITLSTYCVGLYILTKENSGMTIIINIVEGVIAISLLLFLSCWYCNELTEKCRDFTTSAYMSEWINWNQGQKKVLLNLMTRTMSPVTFGGFLKIDLNTLINVLKATFSYYNFLLAVLGNDSE